MWTDKKIQSESNRAEQGRPLLVEGTYWEKARLYSNVSDVLVTSSVVLQTMCTRTLIDQRQN